MNRRMRVYLSCLALAVALLTGLLGTARIASAHPIRQASDPIATVMALIDAFNNADVAKLDALLGPSFTDVILNPPPPLVPAEMLQNREQLKNNASAGGSHATASNCKLTSATTVVCDLSSTGPSLPLPHPFTTTGTFTVQDGKVILIEETLSAQTYSDLQALAAGQPGMPTTGSSDSQAPFAVLVLGLLLLASGFVVRRATSHGR
jgi:hypothetical protein